MPGGAAAAAAATRRAAKPSVRLSNSAISPIGRVPPSSLGIWPVADVVSDGPATPRERDTSPRRTATCCKRGGNTRMARSLNRLSGSGALLGGAAINQSSSSAVRGAAAAAHVSLVADSETESSGRNRRASQRSHRVMRDHPSSERSPQSAQSMAQRRKAGCGAGIGSVTSRRNRGGGKAGCSSCIHAHSWSAASKTSASERHGRDSWTCPRVWLGAKWYRVGRRPVASPPPLK